MKSLPAYRSHQDGTIAFVMLALIAVMSFFIVLNAQTLYVLKQDLKLVDKRQLQHWTNHPPHEVSRPR